MEGLNLANGTSKAKRRELDFYPTPPDVTHALMRFLQDNGDTRLSVWEPACGDGAMSKVIERYGHAVCSSDIRETGYGEGGLDYLATPWPSLFEDTHRDGVRAVITNPPFNRSFEFIEKALGEAVVVAMLLKSQYWHAAKRAPLLLSRPPAYVLPLTWRLDFANGERGNSPTMEVAWTLWIEGRSDARYVPLMRPEAAG